jgi:hypothetical protein
MFLEHQKMQQLLYYHQMFQVYPFLIELQLTSAIFPLCTPVHTVHTGAHCVRTVHTVHTAEGPPSLTSDMLLVSFCCIV